MKTIENFFNSISGLINKDNNQSISRAIELFNNGCLTYGGFINKLSIATGSTKGELHSLSSMFIEDFEGYVYDESEVDKYEGVDVISVHSDCDEYLDIDSVLVELETGERITVPYDGFFEIGGIEYRLTYPDCCGFWFFEACESEWE